MGWPKKLVLVRHAESEGNIRSVDERAEFEKPSHEYSITERGRAQARLTGDWLRENGHDDFHVIYTSYYRRVQDTLLTMFPDAKFREDPRLAEASRGVFSTMTREEMERELPWEIRRKEKEGLYHFRPLGGENWPDVELRIHSFLGTMARDGDSQRWLIVCHGFWLIMFQRLIEHFSIEEAVRRYKGKVFENASVTIYESTSCDGMPRLKKTAENIAPWEGKL